jgi:HEAT repeat protein
MCAIGTDGTFEVVRDLGRGIDLTKYDASRISKADVKLLVSSMYTGADAKEEIKHFFLDVDPGHAAQCLDELFHGPDPEIKSDAVELLVFLKGAESLPWIEKCLTDVDVGFRCAGCSFLAELDCPEAVPRLLRCLREDPSDWVRYAAVDALERQGDTAALPALRQAAKNDQGTDYEGRPIKDRAREAIRRITRRKR